MSSQARDLELARSAFDRFIDAHPEAVAPLSQALRLLGEQPENQNADALARAVEALIEAVAGNELVKAVGQVIAHAQATTEARFNARGQAMVAASEAELRRGEALSLDEAFDAMESRLLRADYR